MEYASHMLLFPSFHVTNLSIFKHKPWNVNHVWETVNNAQMQEHALFVSNLAYILPFVPLFVEMELKLKINSVMMAI